ncbi:MAG: hypothetical protein QM730_26975 [Anaerolineales bacterium]
MNEQLSPKTNLDSETQHIPSFVQSALIPSIIRGAMRYSTARLILSQLLGLSSDLFKLGARNRSASVEDYGLHTVRQGVVSSCALYKILRRHITPISTQEIAKYFKISISEANVLGQICMLLSPSFGMLKNKDEVTLQLILLVLQTMHKAWTALNDAQFQVGIAYVIYYYVEQYNPNQQYTDKEIEFLVSMLNTEVLKDVSSANLNMSGIYSYFHRRFEAFIEGYKVQNAYS